VAALVIAELLVAASPASAVDFIRGFDAYNGDGAINWVTAKNSGIQFAFVKATEGVKFVDARFTANMQGATNAGVYIGPYHICRVDSKNGVLFTSYDGLPFAVDSDPWLDATSEAVDFIKAIRPYYRSGSYLPPVADIETSTIEKLGFTNTSLRKAFVSNWLQVFSDTVQNALGVRPLVYTSKSSANTYYSDAIKASHKLWLAWWKGNTTSPPVVSDTPGWPAWTFWQYTNLESVPGVPGSEGPNGDLEDGDVFYGTQQQLAALLVHNVPGDYNHDGKVDGADYVVWRNSKGSTVNLAADGNSNNVIDDGDYLYWRARVGQTAGSGAAAGGMTPGGVPEPASAASILIASAVTLLLARRR